MMKIVLFFLGALVLPGAYCQPKRNTAGPVIPEERKAARDTGYLSYAAFDRNLPFSILEFCRDIDTTSFGESDISGQCTAWHMDTATARMIIRNTVPISGEEWHHEYDVLPCSYYGRLLIGDKLVGFSINAGGTVSLSFSDTSVALGCRGEDCQQYFLRGRAVSPPPDTPAALIPLRSLFEKELKPWAGSFSQFSLDGFEQNGNFHFENNREQNMANYQSFLSTYRPILAWSPDGNRFVDIYSYQLGLQKQDDHYLAWPDVDQAVLLCDREAGYWNRIWFGGTEQWVEEAAWTSDSSFILAGISKTAEGVQLPFLLMGNSRSQTLQRYDCANAAMLRAGKAYRSPRLAKLEIEGLD